MTSSATQFPITIVSTDTTALREISWTLSSFGYQVVTSSDWSEQAAWQQIAIPSLLLLDAREEKKTQAVLSSQRTAPFVYRIGFINATLATNPNQLIDSGIDDLIHYPVNIGELLSRIKTAGRRLEFERRFNLSMTFDQQTGISTRSGFIRQLERQLSSANETKDGALVFLGIDYVDRLRSQYGYFAVEEATSILAQRLNDDLSSDDFCGILQDGDYAVLLQGCTVSEGLHFAKEISKKVHQQLSALDGERAQLSISGAVSNWPAGDTANDAVNRGGTALAHLRGYGGNLVLEVNEVEQDYSTWKQEFPPYHEVNAQHVMETLPLVLPINGATANDRQGLGIYAITSGESSPPCVPVVDDMGLLLGVVELDSLRQGESDLLQSVDEYLLPISDTIESTLPLDEIISTLATTQKEYLLVLEDKKPIGYITYENIIAMTIDPSEEQEDSALSLTDSSLNSLVIPLS